MLEDKAILIVEDEPMIAMMLEDLLADLGCIVVGPTATAIEAQVLLEQHGCDAAIVDLNLGGTLAHPLIETLRGRGVPVVVATGYGVDEADLPGGCRVLAKPYTLGHVEQALRACLGG